jgi:hypothetical protein
MGGIHYGEIDNPFTILWHPVSGADAKTFKPLSQDVGKDKNMIFFRTAKQPQVDYASFQIKKDGVMRDKNRVYATYYRDTLIIVEGVDVETYGNFEGKRWSFDKDHIYINGNQLVDADRNTFSILSEYYAKDRDYLFALDHKEVLDPKKVTKVKAHTEKLVVLNYAFAYDDRQVFFRNTDSMKIEINTIPFKNEKSIRLVGMCIIIDDSVYEHGYGKIGLVPFNDKVDVATFQFLDGYYYADINQVYYNTNLLNGADRASFSVFSENDYIARDKNSVYLAGKKEELADAATLEVFNSYFFKDKNHVYYCNNQGRGSFIVEGADPNTFTAKKGDFGEDKENIYRYNNGEKKMVVKKKK